MAYSTQLPFDLRALEIFAMVCKEGSMADAARRLGITQPSISQTVTELESRMGVMLFDRSVRPLGLTQLGAVLRQRAEQLLAEARQIGPLLHQVANGRLPLLRLGIVDSLTRTLTPPLTRFLAETTVECSIRSGLTASHADALMMRQLDIFLGAEEVEDIKGLERHILLSEDYVVLCPPGVPAPQTVNELAQLGQTLPLVRYSARSQTGLEIERHLNRLRIELPRYLEFDTPYGVSAAVMAGLGWAITTPLCVAEAALPGATATPQPLPGPALRRHLVVVARRRELGLLPQRIAALCRVALKEVGRGAGA